MSIVVLDLIAGGIRNSHAAPGAPGPARQVFAVPGVHVQVWGTGRGCPARSTVVTASAFSQAVTLSCSVTGSGVAEAARMRQESFPVAMLPEEAERWRRRSLQERRIGRERAVFTQPPSRVALNAGGAVALVHDGREVTFRIERIADGEVRRCNLVLMDRQVHEGVVM